jgi:F-type H+-transporting ATPase subunit beta
MTATDTTHKEGRIVAIAGPVVDVEFPPDGLPRSTTPSSSRSPWTACPTKVTAEVAQQIGDNRVRAISMKPTDGLARGTVVRNTGPASTCPSAT